jgi:uncharacterized membrane protein YczE
VTASSAAPSPDDARYARVLSFPSARELRRRMPPLVVGLFVLGFAIAVSVRARLGVSPWDVLHQGLAHATGVSFGLVVVLVGLVVLVAWIPLHQRVGVGTVFNALSVGFIANLGLYLIPEQHALAVQVAMLLGSIVMFGVGGGLYIGSGLGPGPRDGLMTAIAARGHRIWIVRTCLECSALVVGYVLGGHVGVGTVLLAFAIGPVTHAGLRRFHLPVSDEVPEVLGE